MASNPNSVVSQNEVILVARGRQISGWEDVSVTLSCESFPNSFTIEASWRDPLTKGAVIAAAGDPCEIYIGKDKVVTGYIDDDILAGDHRSRGLRLVGRGKCQDLADCHAVWPGGVLGQGDALTIARQLASFYNIDVAILNGASPGQPVPPWAINYTETSAAIIQRVAQNAGLLAYEDSQGRLVLSAAGTIQATGGIAYGGNVEAWSVRSSMAQRFSEIVCSFQDIEEFSIGGDQFFHKAEDPNVPRFRHLDIAMINVPGVSQEFTIRVADWEVARRAGRGTQVQVKVDSWRDSGGSLWTPNSMIPVDLPGLRIPDKSLCLSEVTFHRANDGTHADLTLFPRQAFVIEPINLLPINAAEID